MLSQHARLLSTRKYGLRNSARFVGMRCAFEICTSYAKTPYSVGLAHSSCTSRPRDTMQTMHCLTHVDLRCRVVDRSARKMGRSISRWITKITTHSTVFVSPAVLTTLPTSESVPINKTRGIAAQGKRTAGDKSRASTRASVARKQATGRWILAARNWCLVDAFVRRLTLRLRLPNFTMHVRSNTTRNLQC